MKWPEWWGEEWFAQRANEMVLRTISNDERAERQRRAGNPAKTFLRRSLSLRLPRGAKDADAWPRLAFSFVA